MKVYEVKPLEGIGEVKLGMDRQKVRSLMGENPETSGVRDHVDNYHNGGFQVFFDDNDKVEFIELLRESGFSATAKGMDLFTNSAKEVLAMVARYSDYNQDDLEVGYSYVFHDLELSLWRPNVPETDEDEDGKYFSTVGIGVSGYYSNSVKH